MEGELAILLIFGTPVLLGIIITLAVVSSNRHARLLKDKQRETFERITLEKLDVIKTAVAMGYSHNELAALDNRLEKLIGRDRLEGLLTGAGVPQVTAELQAVDLSTEAQMLQDLRRQTQ